MVTNMISQLQESFSLWHVAGSFEISLTKWLRGAKMIQLPVTFLMSCPIFTSILFPSLKNIQEDLPKKRKVVFYVEFFFTNCKTTLVLFVTYHKNWQNIAEIFLHLVLHSREGL